MATQQNPTETQPTTPTWHYNARLGIISHDSQACTTCAPWVQHYLLALASRDTSLAAAEDARHTTAAADLQVASSDDRQTITDLRNDGTAIRAELESFRKDHGVLKRKYRDLQDELAARDTELERTIEDRARIQSNYEHLDEELGASRTSEQFARETIEDLRAKLASTEATLTSVRGQLDAADEEIRTLQERNDDMDDTIEALKREREPRRKVARTGTSTSASGSRQSSRPRRDSPDESSSASTSYRPMGYHPGWTLAPQYLARQANASSSSSSAPGPLSTPAISPPPSYAPRSDLMSRIGNADTPLDLDAMSDHSAPVGPTAPPPSRFFPSVGFFSLLPVIYQTEGRHVFVADESIPLYPNGDINFRVHMHYVLAIGGITPDGGTSFVTCLVTQAYFLTTAVRKARAHQLPLPLKDVIVGGRNGVLTSPSIDPQSNQAVDELVNNPRKAKFIQGFLERCRYTPPELRTPVVEYAVMRYGARCRDTPRNAEPSPYGDIQEWRAYLKAARLDTRPGKTSTFCGIPLVDKGYQKAHIEGAKALLAFLPLTTKGTVIRGTIRDHFLRVAATLLCVPGKYGAMTTANRIPIKEYRGESFYDDGTLDPIAAATPLTIAKCLAAAGVSTEEAESWRPWATAYVAMTIEEHPSSSKVTELEAAQQEARTAIDENHSLALTNVHHKSPGYYHPEHASKRAGRSGTITGPAAAGTSSQGVPPAHPPHPDAIEVDTIELEYDEGDDAMQGYGSPADPDERMGPA